MGRGPRVGLDTLEKINIFFSLQRIEPRFLGCPPRSLVAISTERSWLLDSKTFDDMWAQDRQHTLKTDFIFLPRLVRSILLVQFLLMLSPGEPWATSQTPRHVCNLAVLIFHIRNYST